MIKQKGNIKFKIIFFIIAITTLICIFDLFKIVQYSGYYTANNDVSTYQLYLSPLGHVDVVDIGAGNPAIEGGLYGLPFSNFYTLKAKGETDPVFLNLEKNNMKANVEFSYTDIKPQNIIIKHNIKTITISTKSEKIVFTENIDAI